jgi:multimeric flavodoxin WrbA
MRQSRVGRDNGRGRRREIIDISAEKLEPCRICGNGWGSCGETHQCVINDIFQELQKKIREADGLVLVTPVYWWQPSERMKYFMDRFRRCEATKQEGSAVAGKQIDLIAAAGGSGNGTAACLVEMEQWCRHIRAIPKDRIGVTRFNRETMMQAISESAARLVNR